MPRVVHADTFHQLLSIQEQIEKLRLKEDKLRDKRNKLMQFLAIERPSFGEEYKRSSVLVDNNVVNIVVSHTNQIYIEK